MKSIKAFWTDCSWILQRTDLSALAAKTVRKIASCWFDWCYFWILRSENITLQGVHSPSFEHLKAFIKYRRRAYTKEGIAIGSLNAILAGVYAAMIRVATKDGSFLQRNSRGFFGLFPQLRNYIVSLYSDEELHKSEFPRFRCGMDEIVELSERFRNRSFSMSKKARYTWVLDYLELAHDGAFRGSEILRSPDLEDTRVFVAKWRRLHDPICLGDCRVEGHCIRVSFRHMKNRKHYKKNWVMISSEVVITRLLQIHGCESLAQFARLCTAQDPSRRFPLLPKPGNRRSPVTMSTARRWLQEFLFEVTDESEVELRKINLHSPRRRQSLSPS